MGRRVWAKIDLNALKQNYRVAKVAASGAQIMIMLKSNAYGHGTVVVASALKDADAFGIHCIHEAIKLRRIMPEKRIVLLSGVLDATELALAVKYHLELVVHRQGQLDLLKRLSKASPLRLWIKINTGMNRLGFPYGDAESLYQQVATLPCCHGPIHWMTHFAWASNVASTETSRQIHRFHEALIGLPGERSLANSAGILAWPKSHGDWVRPGLMVYGASPLDHRCAKECGLRPVMSLYSRIVTIISVKKGQRIGYSLSWQCYRDAIIGIASIGYGDGYPRHAVSGTPVMVNGKRCPLVGRVSMDLIHIDLTDCKGAKVGDSVLLWGANLPIEEIARSASTVAYELMCQVSERVPRQMVYNESEEVIYDTAT